MLASWCYISTQLAQQLGRCNSLYGFLFGCYSWDIGRDTPRNTRSYFVLSQLQHMSLLSYHSTASVAVCWIWLSSADGEHTSHSVLSSTYLYSGNLVCRSFIWTIYNLLDQIRWPEELLHWWYSEISSLFLFVVPNNTRMKWPAQLYLIQSKSITS